MVLGPLIFVDDHPSLVTGVQLLLGEVGFDPFKELEWCARVIVFEAVNSDGAFLSKHLEVFRFCDATFDCQGEELTWFSVAF